MTTNLIGATRRVGARAGPRIRQWQINCQSKTASDGQQRLNQLYQLILETARQTNPSSIMSKEE
ncbi:MAG: hypothetical protein M1358_12740 [Chloroflexi bacterium]|nr:hypothetical protein [Chloroflexota bacterium]